MVLETCFIRVKGILQADIMFSNKATEFLIEMKDLVFGDVFDARNFNSTSHCCLKMTDYV